MGLIPFGVNLFAKSVVSSFARCTVAVCKSFSATLAPPPKRPMTAYLRFVKQQFPLVYRQYPDLKARGVIATIAKQWNALPPEQKREASQAEVAQYQMDLMQYKSQLSPAQLAALKRPKDLIKKKKKMYRKDVRKLGKPKLVRSPFNYFVGVRFHDFPGTKKERFTSLVDTWKNLPHSQKTVFLKLADDDKIRYEKETTVWEETMTKMGRTDLVRAHMKPKAKRK
ncbi:transcription factor A, mitochondrial isoform X2 [Conger conger]|uniref:transcription factor A, mitochondrial isoform X2 n=1 Tax=Conger conger TaxID=82655 RepID=UPI002A5A9E42|nr:transcription factor A, mitochondrial isoform X2 [Conger conger]